MVCVTVHWIPHFGYKLDCFQRIRKLSLEYIYKGKSAARVSATDHTKFTD